MENFTRARNNLVGVTLAGLVLVAHFLFDLGFLWPLVAAAAYGAGVLLTPVGDHTPRQVEPPVRTTDPSELKQQMLDDTRALRGIVMDESVTNRVHDVARELSIALNMWPELGRYPEQQGEIRLMITEFLPQLRTNLAKVHDPNSPEALKFLNSSLLILLRETREINEAAHQEQLQHLKDNSNRLRMHFGEMPEL